MRYASIKSVAACLSCAALVACETAPQNASLQCGAGGAAAGYLLCKALGGSDSNCLKTAAVVGAGGAAVCYSYSNNLERRRKELAGKENDLDARISYVRGLNSDSQQLNTDLAKRVATMTQRTDELVTQIGQRRVNNEQLAKERQARDDEIKAANAQAVQSNAALAEMKAYRTRSKPVSTELDADIAKQEQLNKETNQLVSQMAAQKSRVV